MGRTVATVIAVLCALVLAPNVAQAKPKIALIELDGDDNGEVRDLIVAAVGSEGTFVSAKEVHRAVDKIGADGDLSTKDLKKLASDLEADAIVQGRVDSPKGENHVLHLKLFVHGKKVKGFKIEFATAKNAKLKVAIHDKMIEKIGTPPDDDDAAPPKKDAKADKADKKKGAKKGDDDADDDAPKKDAKADKAATKKGAKKGADDDSGDDDAPPKKDAKADKKKGAKKGADDDSGDDDAPPKKDAKADKKKGAKKGADDDSGDDDAPPKKDAKADKKKGDKVADKGDKKKGDDDSGDKPDKGDKKKGDDDSGDDDHAAKKGDDDDHPHHKKVATGGDDDGSGGGGDVSASVKVGGGDSGALHAANRDTARIDVGMSAIGRSLSYNSTPGFAEAPLKYKNSPNAGARVDGEIFPLAFAGKTGAIAGLGIAGAFDDTIGLKARPMAGSTTLLPISQHEYNVGLVFRYVLGPTPTSPSFTIGFGYGSTGFSANRSTLQAGEIFDEPDVDYKYFYPSLEGRIPFGRPLALVLGASTWLARSAGSIQDPDQYGQTTVTALEGYIGFDILFAKRFAVRIAGQFTQVGMKFKGTGEMSNDRDGDPTQQDVFGATDRYYGGYASLGVIY